MTTPHNTYRYKKESLQCIFILLSFRKTKKYKHFDVKLSHVKYFKIVISHKCRVGKFLIPISCCFMIIKIFGNHNMKYTIVHIEHYYLIF